MLYFVYTSAGVAVMVAHALKRGEFVAQIPFFPPHQQPEDFDEHRCIALIRRLAGKTDMIAKIFDMTQNRKFQPIVIAELKLQSELHSKAHFSFHVIQ